MKTKIMIPSIKDDDRGFEIILKIARQVMSNPKQHFDFNFQHCARLDHNGIAMLGGLARYVNYQNSRTSRNIAGLMNSNAVASAGVMFLVDTMSELISTTLITNNFLSHFSKASFQGYPKGDYIGYREHNVKMDDDNIAEHLKDQWLSDEKISISDKLKPYIVSRIFEIFMNAYGHGTTLQPIDKLGVYSCGQYNRKERKLSLSVLDFGLGIVENVRLHLKNRTLSSEQCASWALARGNSTSTDTQGTDIPRGLGFDLLNEFIALNEGELRVYSNDIYAYCSSTGVWRIQPLATPFSGTFVGITINCDDRHYRFASEKFEAPATKYF